MELDYVIDTGLEWPKGRTKRHTTDHIQIHHTVGVYGTPAKWKALHESKIKDGNKGVGYSYLICKNGDIYLGRGLECAHGGVKDNITNKANQRSVAIAFDGDMRSDSLPTEAQLASCVRLVNDIRKIYGLPVSAVLGHNEIPTYEKDTAKPTGKTYATLCPCMDMDALRAMLSGDPIEPAEPEKAKVIALTSPYMRGNDIKALQTALNGLGYNCGEADGIAGAKTIEGIQAFVAAHGGVKTVELPKTAECTVVIGGRKYIGELEE